MQFLRGINPLIIFLLMMDDTVLELKTRNNLHDYLDLYLVAKWTMKRIVDYPSF